MYYARTTKRGWRVFFAEIDICGAINERVARETADALNDFRGYRSADSKSLLRAGVLTIGAALGAMR